MNEQLKNHIENLGFTDSDAFVSWQLTQYLLHKIARLEAQAQVFRQKYGMDYASFEKRMEEREEEVFEEWDDSIEWEFLELELKDAKTMLADMEENQKTVYSEEDISRSAGNAMLTYHQQVEAKNEANRKATLVKLYKEGKISPGKAVELARIPQIQFHDWLTEHNIPLHYATDAVDEDMDTINKLGL